MTALHRLIRVGLSLWLLTAQATAQFYSPLSIGPSVMKFLPEDAAFTAAVEMVLDSPACRWPVRVALLEGKTRVEMDISKAEQIQKPPAGWADYVRQMQQAGSAESITIFNPDESSVFTILPKIRAYVKQPIPEDALLQLTKRPQPNRLNIGTDDIGGRAAIKTHVIFDKTDMDVWRTWETPQAIVWTLKDKPTVPLRIQVMDSLGRTNCILVFKEVDLRRPRSQLFKPARSFTKCRDEQELIQRIMEKWPKVQ